MNILIPHSWLLEHLETGADPHTIQEQLSLSGPSVERIYDIEGESVYDIEITTNRVDSMSVRGVAREAATILAQAGVAAILKPLPKRAIQHSGESLPLPAVINDQHLARRTTYVILKNVKQTPTPDWMAKRLELIEQNIHNSVIDITNYVTHELGYPCHAFDYDKVMQLGGSIEITRAEQGESFTTLDGETYQTVGDEVVFKNPDGVIIDFPAIKGTANTSVDDSTQTVMLWIENLASEDVRFGSMTHAIRTVAAQLSEKNVDPHLATEILEYGAMLYQDLCHAELASPLVDTFPGKSTPETVTLPLSELERYLGLKLEEQVITKILTDLGCDTSIDAGSLRVTPPTFRPDIAIPADVIEEVARMYGYHNLPSTLMTGSIPTTAPGDTDFVLENRVKRFLSSRGWIEHYTYSMVSESLAIESGYPLHEHLKLANPLTDDKVYLRRSLIPSLAQAHRAGSLQTNHEQLSIYELANTYAPQNDDLPEQLLSLGLLSNKPYRALLADVYALLRTLYITHLQVAQTEATSGTLLGGTRQDQLEPIGRITRVESQTQVELSWPTLLSLALTHPTYSPAAPTATIVEDLTFTLPVHTHIGPVLETIQGTSPLITATHLLDHYHQNYTVRISYQDPETNISSEAVAPVRAQVVDRVAETHAGTLVGELAQS